MKNRRGITLIALVITIIILLILATVSINLIAGSGLFGRANEAKFKTRMAKHNEEAKLYTSWKTMQTMNTDTTSINSGDILKAAIEQEIIMDIEKEDVNIDIKEILTDVTKDEKEYVVVYKGELYYVSDGKRKNDAQYRKWCQDINIPILEYTPPTGIVVRNGNYELVNGVYLCTPKLDAGFVEENTRYLNVDKNGKLVPGNWITDKPSENWYSYKESKWANIYVETNGVDAYYVWIPRYCFTLDQDAETSDVKFIDIDNNYKDENGNPTSWKELEEKGYQVPEAFTFNGEPLAGYWAMKYTAGDIITPSTVYYDMIINKGKITIKNITLNTTITDSNPIVKYTFALNGKIQATIDDPTQIDDIANQVAVLNNMKAGNNSINVTGLNANGEIVGSMTKIYSPAVVNQPDTKKFNQETTFYVTYDDKGNEHSTVPVSEAMPQYWYDYGETRWANIVTRNNGLETYYVWIPRYQFTLDQTNERSTVKFITGTESADEGYQVPEAFTFNGVELTGFWAMKYTAGDEAAPIFDTEVTATSNSIKTKGITGTGIADGQVYNYYINGEYKDTKSSSTDTYEYKGLASGKTYTILVEVRDSSDKYLGSVLKQIKTTEPNKPELTGFNESMTYYVTYAQDGTEIIDENNIKNDGSNMPTNWYDYSQSKWANIVVTDGTVEDGKITNAKMTTYYTWIPRYAFMITSSQHAQPTIGRTEVRFLEGTSTEVDEGYQIPEAFTFNGVPLRGYWAMKYTAGE